jgi:hypothetical protein
MERCQISLAFNFPVVKSADLKKNGLIRIPHLPSEVLAEIALGQIESWAALENEQRAELRKDVSGWLQDCKTLMATRQTKPSVAKPSNET